MGPPSIDMIGIAMMALIAIIVGAFISLSVLIAAFFSVGSFSVESGVSPIILAFSTFFAVCFGGVLYVVLARSVFPSIYTRNTLVLKNMIIYMIVLYFCMMPIYLLSSGNSGNSNGLVLYAYLVHILLSIFGIEIILGLISQYRYILLWFYANIIAIILSWGITFWIYKSLSASSSALFILMGMSILMFFLSTLITFIVRYIYYKFYHLTGKDPLGEVFYTIEQEEYQKVEHAKNTLLQR